MATPEFRAAVEALWSALRLGKPVFEDQSRIVLEIDRTALTLSESADAQFVEVTGEAGALPAFPREAGRMAQRLLQVNLANLTGSEVCVRLTRQGASRQTQCLGRRSYARARVEGLVSLIEDVLTVTEFWRGELAASRSGEGLTAVSTASNSFNADMMIFRP